MTTVDTTNQAITFDEQALRVWFDVVDRTSEDYGQPYKVDGQGGYRLAQLLGDLAQQPQIWTANGITQLAIHPTAGDQDEADGGMVATFQLNDGPLLTTGRVPARDLVDVGDANEVPAVDAAVKMLTYLAVTINTVVAWTRHNFLPTRDGLAGKLTVEQVEEALRVVAELANEIPFGDLNPLQQRLAKRLGRLLDEQVGAVTDAEPVAKSATNEPHAQIVRGIRTLNADDEWPDGVSQVVEGFEGLDQALRKGAPLPDAWAASQR